jgi:prepilin-type processing-associated H-X9-DG protein
VAAILLGTLNCAGWTIGSFVAVRWHEDQQQKRADYFCGRQMVNIFLELKQYAREHDGFTPARLDDLVPNRSSFAYDFYCPTHPPTAARIAAASSGTVPLASDYIYTLPSIRLAELPTAARTVVLYEPLANHGGRGVNMLFADGGQVFVPVAQARPIIAELENGLNPPPSLHR